MTCHEPILLIATEAAPSPFGWSKPLRRLVTEFCKESTRSPDRIEPLGAVVRISRIGRVHLQLMAPPADRHSSFEEPQPAASPHRADRCRLGTS